MNPTSALQSSDKSAGSCLLPGAVIYNHSLLEGSNTFIKSHAEALSRYVAIYTGAHRANGIALPSDRSHVLNEHTIAGFCREALFRKLGWAPSLIRKLKSHQPVIVHAHFGTSGPAGMAIADALNVPLLVTFHGADATINLGRNRRSHRERELSRKKSQLIQRSGAFIAVSGFIRDRLVDQGYPESKIILHRNGIDLDFFCSQARRSRDARVVFVGRFVEKKGAEYLVEAAGILKANGVPLELVMIGSGPLADRLKQMAAEANVSCQFPGFLSGIEVRDWLESATVVAVPSVTAANGDSEGLPTVLLEAQAMETPVVATRHSGIPEGVIDGKSAELVDERDTRGLAAALSSFLTSPKKCREFGEAGRHFVATHFNLRTQVDALEEIYDEQVRRYGMLLHRAPSGSK
jgi:colanic acid/amylovoran biosynthesis glycosyltransferase